MSPSSLPGIVRATLIVAELAACTSGEISWEATFREARRGACKGMHLSRLPAGKLIVLVLDTLYAREVICTVRPVKGCMVTCFSLKNEVGEWRVRPQVVTGECFELNALIEIERTDWLNAPCVLMLGLRSPEAIWKPDMAMWEIVSAWESWQRRGLTWMDLSKLQPHPFNATVYGEEKLDEEFVKNVEQRGIYVPLIVTPTGKIISGHRRYAAAVKLNLPQVPVIVRDLKNELNERETLIATSDLVVLW